MDELDRLRTVITRALRRMPDDEFLCRLQTHSQRRVIVHEKMSVRLDALLHLLVDLCAYAPRDKAASAMRAASDYVSVVGELGECVIQIGTDAVSLGDTYSEFLRELELAIPEG